MRMIQLANLKVGLRRFLAEDTSAEVVFAWDPNENHLDINRNGRGIEIMLPPDAMNAEGDYLTEENKQDIVDTLQAIVDEHNAQVE